MENGKKITDLVCGNAVFVGRENSIALFYTLLLCYTYTCMYLRD